MKRTGEKGSALLVAVILVAVVTAYVINNCVALNHVREYLVDLDARQSARLEKTVAIFAPAAESSNEIR